MDDDHFVLANPVIDQIGIAGGRRHANAGNIGLTPEPGMAREQAAKPADVKIPLQAHFANKDDWCTPQLVDGFEKAMKAAGKSLELFRYDAEHAFVNEQRMNVHDRHAAELAWGRATEFFRKHLE